MKSQLIKRTFAVILSALMLISILTPVYAYATAYQLGDVDMDGAVTVRDVTLIQQHSAMLITLNDSQLALADVDGSADADVRDATYIQQYVAKIITNFPSASEPATEPATNDSGYGYEDDDYGDFS